MTRSFQTLLTIALAAFFLALCAPTAPADEMVLFKNGKTLRADELELEDGVYRITTMAGGVMEVPEALVARVVTCMVDKDVEEQRGTAPASPPPRPPAAGKTPEKIPPAGGSRGAKGGTLGGGKGGARGGAGGIGGRGGNKGGSGVKVIPPKGGAKNPGKSKTPPDKSAFK